MKCADCTMSGVPCPTCYEVNFRTCFPSYDAARMTILELDMRLIIRCLLRTRLNTPLAPIPRHLAVLLQIYHFNLDGKMNDADLRHKEPRGELVERLAATLEDRDPGLRPAADLVDECLAAVQKTKDLVEKLR
jgi:hypothetical protein